jgi:hypothetical protein
VTHGKVTGLRCVTVTYTIQNWVKVSKIKVLGLYRYPLLKIDRSQAGMIAEVQSPGNTVKHAKCTLNKQMQAYLTWYLMTVDRVQISQSQIHFQYGHCIETGSDDGLFVSTCHILVWETKEYRAKQLS